MIYSPIQLAFIKFLEACIAKNKNYGYINLTNKQIAERFTFRGRKYSFQNIALLISQIKHEFTFQSNGSRRYILSKSVTSQTLGSNQSDTRQQLVRHYTVTSQTLEPEQETLEPQGLETPFLIDKNKDQEQIKEKLQKEKPLPVEKILSTFEVSSREKEAILAFIAHRKQIKKPMTLKAVELLVKKLQKMAKSENERIELVEYAILNGWQGIYPIPVARGKPDLKLVEEKPKIYYGWQDDRSIYEGNASPEEQLRMYQEVKARMRVAV